MIGESNATSTLNPPGAKASVLITISTPEADTPICRLGDSEDVVSDLTVRQLIKRVISPNSLFSVGVPISQLQAESPTALAIGELLSADCCQVMAPGKGPASHQNVSLDERARSVAREQVGTQGNRFLNISLEVRSAPDSAAPSGEDRRLSHTPPTMEIEQKQPVLTGSMIETSPKVSPVVERKAPAEKAGPAAFGVVRPDRPATAPEALSPKPTSETAPKETASATPKLEALPVDETPGAAEPAPAAAVEQSPEASLDSAPLDVADPKVSPDAEPDEPASGSTAPAEGTPATGGILTIVAEKLSEEPKAPGRDRKEYARKADWLRAQFLPEVETLDFSGLFVGNLGIGIRQEKARRNVVMADPARITEVLLRANGYRRNGDHPKALICYQELIDMDPSNSDFRFLLGKTLIALGQRDQAVETFNRAKELGHDGAAKELEELKNSGHRPKAALGFLRFWK